MAFAKPATDPMFFGITRDHWRILEKFVRDREYVVALRTGKKSAVPWIEKRFPAKPLELGAIKVDREAGLLIARTPMERDTALRAGYAVLQSADGRGLEFVAATKSGHTSLAGARFVRGRDAWAGEGVILDPRARLPITSDYDLAAVVDTKDFDYALTYASTAGSANRTNPIVAAVAATLNGLFGSPRIMHGSQAQYTGSLANKDDDEILIFHPAGEVEYIEPTAVLQTDLILHDIIKRYFPDSKHVFNQ